MARRRRRKRTKAGSGETPAIVLPTPERMAHGPVEPPARQIVDARGEIGAPFRGVDWLALMARRGVVTDSMRAAGERFSGDFRLALLDPVRAIQLDRPRVQTGAAANDLSGGVLGARRRIAGARRALGGAGSPCERAAWHVLGFGHTVAEWCRADGGRMRADTAKGILVGALGVLAVHYGLERKPPLPKTPRAA
ncbi:MAG: DUF6456 domain-containing protein [Alphaproteobacteria bacterium]